LLIKQKRGVMDKKKTDNNNIMLPVELHPSEKKLIETIREIDSGEIESIKIQNSIPVIFKITLGEGKLCEE
jgi:hypothetical protein